MSTIEFALPYPPSTNRVWRMAAGRMVQPESVKHWKRSAGWAARAAGVQPLTGQVAVSIILHPRLTTTGRTSAARLDLDNVLKATLDALIGVAYDDDRRVVDVRVTLGHGIPDGGLTVALRAADCAA